ncbi:MFS transporter [Burkholderia perseverans]|uniref:MFS transporter n=1 Tax=Burkholderia perseverans TaxID=2615214 RepID=UPI001FED880A|nr:MFS transporter [Burkholderia perseverans]
MKEVSYRWRICALLFTATTINYLDRQVLGILKPDLALRFNWSETQYSHVVVVFALCYGAGMLLAGKLIDRIGVKAGYGLSVLVWSVASCAHALVTTTLGFGWVRALLGLSESGSYPSAVKAISEWFPRSEQALAVGIVTAGTSIGAVAAPAVVPWLAVSYGWQAAFVVTGLTGFVWLACWQFRYAAPLAHPKVSARELALIGANRAAPGEPEPAEAGPRPGWRELFRLRETWTVFIGKGLTDPIWWFLLFWLPSYFSERFHLDLRNLGLPLVIVYVATSIGSIAGGWLSSALIARGWPVQKARQTAMLCLALLVVPMAFAPWIDNMWVMVGLLSLSVAAHQGWSANMFTLASDMFPKAQVASVTGIGGLGGAIGASIFPLFVGVLLDHFRALGNINAGYNALFMVCGLAYVVTWVLMKFVRPSRASAPLGESHAARA